MNSKLELTISKGDFVLKDRLQRFLVYKNKTDSKIQKKVLPLKNLGTAIDSY